MCSDTKEKIAEAVEQMMLTKPVSKITVQSVMEQAQMKRQTFYYHYQDIYSVLEWIVVREICTPLRYDESVSAEDWCMQALALLRARQPLLRRISLSSAAKSSTSSPPGSSGRSWRAFFLPPTRRTPGRTGSRWICSATPRSARSTVLSSAGRRSTLRRARGTCARCS